MNRDEMKAQVELTEENDRLRKQFTALYELRVAAKPLVDSELIEKVIMFDVAILRRGVRGLTWLGVSPEDFDQLKLASKFGSIKWFDPTESDKELTMVAPSGKLRIVPIAVPRGCFFQLREPMFVRNDVRVHSSIGPSRHDGINYGGPLPQTRNFDVLQFEIRPLQPVRMEVKGDDY